MQINDPVRNPTPRERLVIRILVGVGMLSTAYFCYYFFQPGLRGHPALYAMLVAVVGYGVLRNLNLWYHYLNIQVPVPPPLERDFTVDVLTTYYPGEPQEMTIATLSAIQRITYPHTAYLCDEANDPHLRAICDELGVRHVTRTERVNAKAGNINNALRQATGEVCLILDPDHVPEPDFLDHVLPYFQDERVGFVQVAQVYYNKEDSLVAKGAAQQTYHFYGPMMMSMQGYGAVNAIGANCTFRRSALDAIGGHAPGLAEDMHTAMLLYERQYRSVYLPHIVAEGLVPNTLDAYYHQQLKWARGTLDLLTKVYPRIFSRLTPRQRIHYLLSSLHYLVGAFYLVGFLIPILSLLFSLTPWRGDLILFLVISLPLLMSNFVIRFYIQKWLVADEERGFHIVGGLLEIGTWWIYLLGLVYTVIDKKIPYLPTAKDAHGSSHPSAAVPNVVVGVVSVAAITVGLYRDLTPYSIVMATFALVTAVIMFFSVLLAFGTTNRNRQLQRRLPSPALRGARWAKRRILGSLNAMTIAVRQTAVPALVTVGAASALASAHLVRAGWEDVNYTPDNTTVDIPVHLSGIFLPVDSGGLSSASRIAQLTDERSIGFDLVAAYEPWGDTTRLAAIASAYDFPIITWEPWVRTFARSQAVPELNQGHKALQFISEGYFDDYILASARILKASGKPVLLRFAHEFTNPFYPWSPSGNNTPQEFVSAWRHVHALFREAGATNVGWVWNPWESTNMEAYYPGDDYVDWVGLTTLDYGPSFPTIPSVPFVELYLPFRNALAKFCGKPIILAEFGSLGSQATKRKWVGDAMASIDQDFPEIKAVVAFNSSLDVIQPANGQSTGGRLDWTLVDLGLIADYSTAPPETSLLTFGRNAREPAVATGLPALPVHGRAVRLASGSNWSSSYRPLSRENLSRDFALMREWGIGTIILSEPSIYAHNLLGISREYSLKVIYEFPLPELNDLLADSEAAQRLSLQILSKVQELRGEESIVGWGFARDQLEDIAERFEQPLTRAVHAAYRDWTMALSSDILAADPVRPVLTEDAPWTAVGQWKDRWQNDRISFDGLLDGYGRIKTTHGSPPGISRTARAINPGDVHTYKAAELDGKRWVLQNADDGHATYEWALVAKDQWGYYRSRKALGEGTEIQVDIPQDYERYELMLSRVIGDSARSVFTSLNTPLSLN